MKHNAIYALYSNVVRIDESEGAFDKDNNLVDIDLAAVEAWQDPIEYKYQRQQQYPPIGDQLDALWKGGEAAAEMLAKVQAVKNKYPKPE